MARDHLLVIDQGTTSTRSVVYNARLEPVGQGQIEVLPDLPPVRAGSSTTRTP